MKFKRLIDSPSGIRFISDNIELSSGYSRTTLMNMPLLYDQDSINEQYDELRLFYHTFIDTEDGFRIGESLRSKISRLKDITNTLRGIQTGSIPDDIELFEIKALAALIEEISSLMKTAKIESGLMDNAIEVTDILDPDKTGIGSFYIYDSYSDELAEIRREIKAIENSPQEEAKREGLLYRASQVEYIIREELASKLIPFIPSLKDSLDRIAMIDISLAKAMLIKKYNMVVPVISQSGHTRYKGLFNPGVKEVLADKNREFQPIDIDFDGKVLIIGANMGGKSVVLKTIALCQYLFQFALPVPALSAEIEIKEKIIFIIGDHQNETKGISSFAAEILAIEDIITESAKGCSLLALVDEPAKTTNPIEGTALVSALLKVIESPKTDMILATHYNIDGEGFKRLKVKGLINNKMDYSLIETHSGDVPREALAIAESLGVSRKWIEIAKDELNKKRDKNDAK